MRLRLQAKALLFFGLLMAIGLGTALIYGYRSQRSVLMEMSEQRFLAIADNLAGGIFRNYEVDDWRGLQSFIEYSTARETRDVITAAVVDTTGTVVAATRKRTMDHRFNQPEVQNVIAARKSWVSVNRASTPWTIEILAPITSESAEAPVKAVVYVAGSLQSVQDGLRSAAQRQVIVFLIVTVAGFLFTLIYVRKGILRPIRELSGAIQRVVAGDFHRLATRKTHDEIGELASSFDWMTEELRRSQEYLQDYNRTLMEMVAAEEECNRLDRVISSIAYALIEIDDHGSICRWNKAAAEIFGLPSKDVIGRPLHETGIPWDWQQVAALVDGSLDDNESWHRDAVPYTRPDGTPGYLAITTSRVEHTDTSPGEYYPMYVLLAADMTERKRAAEDLERSLSLLRATLDSTADGLLVVDAQGQVVTRNRRFAAMWKIPESVLSSGCDDTLLQFALNQLESPEAFLAKVRELYNQPDAESWDVLEFKDGRVFERYSRPQYINEKSVGRVWSFRDISERRQAESVLRASEEYYRALIENTSDIIISAETDGTIRHTSAAVRRILGFTPEQLPGRKVLELVHPDDRAGATDFLQRAAGNPDSVVTRELRAIHMDGSERIVEVTGRRMLDGSDVAGLIINAHDITNRRRADEGLLRYNRVLNTINACHLAVIRATEETSLLEQICRVLVDVSGYMAAWVGYAEHDDRKSLRPVAQAGCADGSLQGAALTWGGGEKESSPLAMAVTTGKPQVARHISTEPSSAASDERVGRCAYGSSISLPLRADAEVFGVLNILAVEPGALESQEECDLLQGLADDLAYGIGALRSLAESKWAAAEMRTSKARLRSILDGASDAIISVDGNQNIIQFNRRAERVFGFQPGEVIGRSLGLLLPERFGPTHEQFVAQFAADQMPSRAMGEFRPLVGRRKNGDEFPVEVSISKLDVLGQTICTAIVRDVTERRQAEESQARLAAAVEQAVESIFITDTNEIIQYVNPAFEWTTGLQKEVVTGRPLRAVLESAGHDVSLHQDLWDTMVRGEVWRGRLVGHRKDGTTFHEDATVTPVSDASGAIVDYVGVFREVTQQIALEAQLRQSQKLEAVGSLAAGIAHEINTPIQFVGDNVRFLSDSFAELCRLLERTSALVNTLASRPELAALVRDFAEAQRVADMDYLRKEVPKAVEQTLDGVARVARIVRAMKDFSHPDQGEKGLADLNRALQSTLTVANNELKYVANVVTDFDESLPSVWCHLGDLNQVFLNLLVNAAHAIAGVVGDGGSGKGTITVTTRSAESTTEPGTIDGVVVSVADTGTGIPEAIRDRVFEQFFTTKEVGRGTGQGLAIARAVVVDKHAGRIWFTTETGKGTTFHIHLPIGAEEVMEVT